MSEPIDELIERWHAHTQGNLAGGLDELLDDEVVFYSPVVFTPQRGKPITAAYLQAALGTLAGGMPVGSATAGESGFRYTRQVTAGDTAVLEFETTMAGKYVNGVDIIRCNDAGKIVEFRVMIRPLQALNAVHEAMRSALEAAGEQP